MLIYLEAKYLNEVNFATFNLLLNITNFAFVLFIGLNIGIQMFLKEFAVNDLQIIKIIITTACGVSTVFVVGVLIFIALSNLLVNNNILGTILSNKMFYLAILNIYAEGVLMSLIAYLTWRQSHNKINIIKIIVLYGLILMMIVMKLFDLAFLFILATNIICIVTVFFDLNQRRTHLVQ